MKKFLLLLRFLFLSIIIALIILFFASAKGTETNILKAILTNSAEDNLLIDLSLKNSGKINVVFESEDSFLLQSIRENFMQTIDNTFFIVNEIDFNSVLDTYKKYQRNLLSDKSYALLVSNNQEEVLNQSIQRLYNPMSVFFDSLENDPYLLFSDYIQSLGDGYSAPLNKIGDKYYESAELFVNSQISLSPSLLNVQISNLLKQVDKLVVENESKVQIYLSGVPIHTYYASSNSIKEINIISLVSISFILFVAYFFFRNLKILIPIILSLFVGLFMGYCVTTLLFKNVHVLTFVFATTLIGICVDYSLHYFAHNKDLQIIFKSLSQGMLTTVLAFLILLFSNITLLKQIAVFTATGLVFVYLFVVLFYPLICKNIDISYLKTFNIYKFNNKIKYFFISTVLAVIVLGLFNLNFNDSIQEMYLPPKKLVNAEKLYTNVSAKTFESLFLIVNGQNLQEVLEKEEIIAQDLRGKNIEYYSMSKFLPSHQRQAQNLQLVNELYQNTLRNYATFLSSQQVKKLLDYSSRGEYLDLNELGLNNLNDFRVNDNANIMIVNSKNYSPQIEGITVIDLKNDISQKIKECRQACFNLFIPICLMLFCFMACVYGAINSLKIIASPILGALFALFVAQFVFNGINLFHVLALFLIIGFSLDYSIFRFNGGKNSSSYSAVFISCITTVFSFLLLSITSFRLISSLGFMLWVGILSSYILSLFFISTSTQEQILSE